MRDLCTSLNRTAFFCSKILQDSIFGDSPTRDLDTAIEGPFMSSTAKQKISSTQHPLHKVSTVAKDTSSSEDATVTERKPGVFHAADNGKEKEAKQEYIEETQGRISTLLCMREEGEWKCVDYKTNVPL